MCDDMPACHAGIPNVKGWCLINHGVIPILSCSIRLLMHVRVHTPVVLCMEKSGGICRQYCYC